MKVNFKTLAFIIIFLSLLEPDYFTSIDIIHDYYIVMRVITLFLAFLYFLVKNMVPKITSIIVIYFGIYGFSTYINNGDMMSFFAYSSYIVSFVAWLEITLRRYTMKGLYSLNFVYSLHVYINLFFYIVFPQGYTYSITYAGNVIERYFLGVENQFASTLIPAIVINIVYNYAKHSKLKINSYLLIITVLFTFIYIWSATSIVGISLIILYLLLINRKKVKAIINNKTIIITTVSLFISVVVLRIIDIFSFLIEDLLGKDVTLSTRTLLWDRAFIYIENSPWLGYGYLGSGRYLQVTSTRFMDSHNTVLQLLLQHGYLGLILFAILVFMFFKNLSIYKESNITKFILFSFFVATTMMLSEVYSFTFLLVILVLGIFSPYIIREQEKTLSKG